MTIIRNAGSGSVAASLVKRIAGGSRVDAVVRRRLSGAWVNAISVRSSPISEVIFEPEPAPMQKGFTGYPVVNVVGGPVDSASWSHVSGAVLSISNPNILQPVITGTLSKNTELNSTYRVTVTSGGGTSSADVPIFWKYWTDL